MQLKYEQTQLRRHLHTAASSHSVGKVNRVTMIAGGRFKNPNEFVNVRTLKFSTLHKIASLNVWVRYCVEFHRYPLQFHTKYTAINRNTYSLLRRENLRPRQFTGSYAFVKRPKAHISQQFMRANNENLQEILFVMISIITVQTGHNLTQHMPAQL